MTTTVDALPELADLSAAGLLDEVDAWHREQRAADARLVVLVAEFARQHGEETVDPVRAQLPGRERAVLLGGPGTPKVAEFAPAVLGARLQLSPHAGRSLFADVLDLEHRLPQLWRRLLAGEVRLGHARFVARRTRELGAQGAALVDARVAESADGRLAWSRFVDLVEASIVAADPDAAREREERAARESFVRTTHSNEHGMRGLYARGDAPTIARIDATVAFLAKALLFLGDTRGADDRRLTALLLMSNPAQAVAVLRAFRDRVADLERSGEMDRDWAGAGGDDDEKTRDVVTVERFDPRGRLPEGVDLATLLPTILMFVHLSQDGEGSGPVARVEGEPPVTAEWVRRVMGERCRFRIKPVVDPLGQTPVDGWEVPDRHREAVHLMTPGDVFPFASSTDRVMQVDHTVPYAGTGPPGQSRIGNYGPMVGFHHRIKTHGRWQVAQPFPGIYLWRDPHGAIYLVDHTGTRRIGVTLAS